MRGEADALAAFLGPMLRIHPERRAKAAELVHHNFLDGVVVQGEVDVIRRLEIEEAERRKAVGARAVGAGAGAVGARGQENGMVVVVDDTDKVVKEKEVQGEVPVLDQSVQDAMKPVDSDGSDEEDDDDDEEEEEEGEEGRGMAEAVVNEDEEDDEEEEEDEPPITMQSHSTQPQALQLGRRNRSAR